MIHSVFQIEFFLQGIIVQKLFSRDYFFKDLKTKLNSKKFRE